MIEEKMLYITGSTIGASVGSIFGFYHGKKYQKKYGSIPEKLTSVVGESLLYNSIIGTVIYLTNEAIFDSSIYDISFLGGHFVGYTAGRWFGTEPPEEPPGKKKGKLIKRVLDKMPVNAPSKEEVPVRMVPEGKWREYIGNLAKSL